MLQWTSVLLLVAPVTLLVYALRSHDAVRPASLRTLVSIYLIAGLTPLVFAIVWRLDATRIVIELHAIAFRSQGGSVIRKDVSERRRGNGRIVIGDATRRRSPQRFGTLVFRDRALHVELPHPSERTGLIGSTANGLLGAEPLEDQDQICVAGTCWIHDASDRSFTHGQHVVRIPRREAQIPGVGWAFPLPFAKPPTAGLRTWSVGWMAHETGAIPADRNLRSFLAYANPGSQLRLIVLDREVSLMRHGRAVTIPATFPIENGERLSFYTFPAESAAFEARGIAERRSAVLRTGEHSFELDLDTPEIHSLTAKELHTLETEAGKQRRVALSMGDAQLVDRSLYFAGLSESVAVQSNALFELSRYFPRDFRSAFRVVTPRGPVESALGKVAWIGTSDLAAVRLDVVRPPLLLLLIGVVLLLCKAASAWSVDLTIPQALMAGAIEILAGLRLLLGYRVWAMPPHRIEAAQLALVAWMALPWIFLAASLPKLRSRAAAPVLAGLFLSAVFCARVIDGPTKWIWFLVHLLPLLPHVRLPAWRLPAMRLPASWLKRTWKGDPIVIAAVAFTVVRVFLLLFGFKESASLGARVSLSILHIPAAVVLEGIFLWRAWSHVKKNGKLAREDLLAAMAILVFVWTIPALITSDIGLALLNVPAFLLLLLALTRQAEAKGARALSRALVAMMVLFVAGAPLLRLALPLFSNDQFLLSAASDSNYARFLHMAAPERLQELATKRGESLTITSAILQSYISSGFFGRGYGHSEVSPHLGDTALRDFAPAVFIAAEWGLAGTLAALLAYLLFSFIARAWLPWHGDGSTPAPAIAAVAAATITVSSVYMILANHELLLLTGKNAYLLGLDSAGDVMELLVLLLLIAYGARVARPKTAIQSGGSL